MAHVFTYVKLVLKMAVPLFPYCDGVVLVEAAGDFSLDV